MHDRIYKRTDMAYMMHASFDELRLANLYIYSYEYINSYI